MYLEQRANNANTTQLPPPPIVVAPSGDFDGNDGKWSTFYINIGDDGSGRGQNFKVLIFTSSPVTMVPQQSEWCNSDCAAKRGVMVFNGEQPLGFESQQSKAWKDAGIYTIPLPHWWSGNKNLSATWGSENVGLGESSKQSDILASQWVMEYTFKDFYMGSFGLAVGAVNPGSGSKDPFLANLNSSAQMIPSVSYGYTAGAYYRNSGKGVVGNLVLGGYDKSRVVYDKRVSIGMPNEKNNTLVVGVESILYKPDPDVEANTFSFTTESKGFFATIDSELPYLWLPDVVCDHFADRFQLDYDDSANLYKVNSSAHQHNTQQNATVSFKIGSTTQDSNDFTTIELPYSAFDLTISSPLVDNDTQYFPLKKSRNGMYVLGRAFLQEAYIIVDYERGNFTVAPAYYSQPMPDSKIVSIYNKTYVPPSASLTPIPSKSGGLSPGAVAGIVVGIVVVLLLAALGAFFWWKKRRPSAPPYEEKPTEIDTMVAGNEVKHRRVSELDSEPPGSPKPPLGFYGNGEVKDTIPFPPISEMESPPAELWSPPHSGTPFTEGNGNGDYFGKPRRRGATRESSGNSTPGITPVAELPGDDGGFQVGGQHFEPVASPKISPVHTRGPSENSLRTNIDEVMTRTDPSPERRAEAQSEAIAEESEGPGSPMEKPEDEDKPEGEVALERRPSHARGLSDTTIQSESTAVSEPTAEERERWAQDTAPRRPLSE